MLSFWRGGAHYKKLSVSKGGVKDHRRKKVAVGRMPGLIGKKRREGEETGSGKNSCCLEKKKGK